MKYVLVSGGKLPSPSSTFKQLSNLVAGVISGVGKGIIGATVPS